MSAASKIPPLRFKGFEGVWEEKRLGEMGSPYNGLSGKCKSDFGHGNGRYVTYLNVFNNSVVGADGCDRIEVDKSQNEVCDGDVFFTTSSETPEEVGMASVWRGNGDNTYLNSFCFGYRPKSKINADFWAHMLRADSFRDRIVVLAQGISRYNISKSKVMELHVSLPTDAEQRKIGSTFRALDALIADRESAVEKLQTLKKAMLEKMFPRAGAKVPEVRFKGFVGEWEEKRLGDICEGFDYGLNVAASEYDGRVKYIRITDIDDDSRLYSKAGVVSPGCDIALADACRVNVNDILFARTGASVGKTYLYRESDGVVCFAGFLIRAHVKNGCDAEFVFQNTLTKEYGRYVEIVSQRSGQPGMNAVECSLFEFLVPSLPEQRKIGAYFRSIDALISARQEEIGKLKDLKKALLDRMFV